jgi:hypothetical protein
MSRSGPGPFGERVVATARLRRPCYHLATRCVPDESLRDRAALGALPWPATMGSVADEPHGGEPEERLTMTIVITASAYRPSRRSVENRGKPRTARFVVVPERH